MEFEGRDTSPLTADDLARAAATLKCDVPALEAVSRTEAPGGGFIEDGRPALLYESHPFHVKTNGAYDATHPNISTPTWVHNYGAAGAHQYDRLAEAIALNRDAALQSASWGKYQILGANFRDAGYDNVEAFVADMCDSEAYQLDAYVAWLQNTGLDDPLRRHDWPAFSLGQNGTGQVEEYTARIQQNYEEAVA